MKVVNSIIEAGKYPNLCVALGNFDGVHLGHQELINAVIKQANKINGTPAVLIFSPHPSKIIAPDVTLKFLINNTKKINLLEKYGIKLVIQLPFTREFANIKAQKFIMDLVENLDLAELIVGFNYTFGKGGTGDWVLLEQISKKNRFSLIVVKPVKIYDTLVSSTAIRTALSDGDVTMATKLLGRPPVLAGFIESGNKTGRKLGFPITNIKVDSDILLPQIGVYLTLIMLNKEEYFGLLNIGLKQTITGTNFSITEIHIFDFNQNIYGEYVEIYLLERLRGEVKFNKVEDLREQIYLDIKNAQSIINLKYKKNSNNFI